MSVLSNKSVLFIGEVNKAVIDIEDSLQKHGMNVYFLNINSSPSDINNISQPDLIIVNHIDSDADFTEIIKKVQSLAENNLMPVFILINSTNLDVQEAVKYGAYDYLSPGEGMESILQKVKNIFQTDSSFSMNAIIDITPEKVDVTVKGIKVYTVEDDPLLRNLLNTRFEKSSFPHEFSSSAEGAILAMKQFKPQVIVLDLMLPGKDGFELLAEIKADDTLKDVPVIIFSNRDSQIDRKKTQDLGANAFRVKAMTDLSELIELIQQLAK